MSTPEGESTLPAVIVFALQRGYPVAGLPRTLCKDDQGMRDVVTFALRNRLPREDLPRTLCVGDCGHTEVASS